jgi:hypothetical protein
MAAHIPSRPAVHLLPYHCLTAMTAFGTLTLLVGLFAL